ncbi:gamma-glutamylcyclotransferase family protein [Paremcibacter congregatus]|uniref:gamma-glutamylcyclotransferase family protein n=1 Tax=Paremcibacter congregatus TaxID=2043170 RepID=UPI003A92BED4
MNKKLQKISGLTIGLFIVMAGLVMAEEYNTGGKNTGQDELIYHFGYGSNMDEDFMRKYTPSLKFITTANLPNFEIQFRKYSTNLKGGISSIIPKPGGMVHGVVYTILKKEMEALDILEEVPEKIYSRETFKVLGQDGIWYNADLYRVTNPKGPFTPSLTYLGYMIKGAREKNINKDWLAHLEAMREKVMQEKAVK